MGPERYFIGNVGISRVNLSTAIEYIEDALTNDGHDYICVTNSRTAYLANRDEAYCAIQNNSQLTVPDGAPLAWIAKNQGLRDVGKVSGMDLMNALFAISGAQDYAHYFYGSTQETIERMVSNLKRQYPGLEIKGAVSPPFQPVEDFDLDALANEVNTLKPTFFWCGLGAPKQERLIALLQPKLDATICVGVGLAFEYFGGTVTRAPLWMQNSGMEWVFRFAQQPQNIRRELAPFTWIFIHLIESMIRGRARKSMSGGERKQ
jgi:N-acetylglucosaminyldiphosphoundecaprenol N-acetyl-beta-D-mannosaminyltransferase